MSAYVIGINKRTIDPQGWSDYLSEAGSSFPDNSAVLAKFGRHLSPEGDDVEGIAVFEFPSFEEAVDWYRSSTYQNAIRKRLGASEFQIYIVDGHK